MIFRKRRPPTPLAVAPSIPANAAVPDFETWPADGIAGRIGRGEHAGRWVIASCDDTPFAPPFGYHLMLPLSELLAADGSVLLVSGCSDEKKPDGGGLIDLLTKECDVTWSTDHADYLLAEAEWQERFEREIDEERKQKGLPPFDWASNARPETTELVSFTKWLKKLSR